MTDSAITPEQLPTDKFSHPDLTAKGDRRAQVALKRLDTLWFNTGTLCNIECANCYIESSPKNDRLAYLSAGEVRDFLQELEQIERGPIEIGFTGGEPFMNPDILQMLEDALSFGHRVLILTNAMQPMRRPRLAEGLVHLIQRFGPRMTFRVSLDHYTQELHEKERGADTWKKALSGIDWLAEQDVTLQLAGRTLWHESEDQARQGFESLVSAHGWTVDTADPSQMVLFPEMDDQDDVPEITTACWDILGMSPQDVMCASSRMVVKRRGESAPVVLPCTLIAYRPEFEMGASLREAAQINGGMFDHGAVKLCHPYCAKFCVLGGGSCSV